MRPSSFGVRVDEVAADGVAVGVAAEVADGVAVAVALAVAAAESRETSP
jgi:hypothetical protein